MSFNPAPEKLEQVLKLVEFISNATTTAQLNQATEQFQEYNKSTEFSNYLALIFSNAQYPVNIRNFAGVSLKKKLSDVPLIPSGAPPKAFTEQQVFHIRSCLIKSLSDTSPEIRKTAANTIVTILRKTGFELWPEVIQDVVSLLQYGDDAMAGAFRCLYLICEDCVDEMESLRSNPLDSLVPLLIRFFEHPNLKWKIEAIRVYETLLYSFPSATLKNMQSFLNGLTGLASIENPSIRKHICSCFVAMLDRPKYLDPVFQNVVEYVLICSSDESDESVAQEASKFWMTLAEVKSLKPWLDQLRSYLPRLVPILLKGTVYSEFERRMKEEDAIAPSKESEINPAISNEIQPNIHKHEDEYSDDEEELLDEDDIMDELEEMWNLRKYSAQTLNYMSQHFGAEFLSHLLPHVENYLKEGNPWHIRESGVLALGAVEKGCGEYLAKYLPSLIPYLMSIASKEMPTLRSVALWTISKFSEWITEQNEDLFSSILKLYLTSMMDGNKKVQEASISALCTLHESAGERISPYVGNIVETLEVCFSLYRHKSLLIIFDAIGTLSEAAPKEVANPNYVSKIIPRLIQIWQDMKEDDKKMLNLMSALSVFSSNIGESIQPYAQAIVGKCVQLIQRNYSLIQENLVNRGEAKQFIITALDLISGVVCALPEKAAFLLANQEFFNMLQVCLSDTKPDVKQVSFGLLGDMAKGSIDTLRVGLPLFMPIVCDNLVKSPPAVASNAAWAISEIAYALKGDIVQYMDIDSTIQNLNTILNTDKVAMSVIENTTVAIGTLSLVCPQKVLPHVDSFFKNFCFTLGIVKHPEEKDRSYRGLCEIIRHNVQLAVTYFPCICDAAVNMNDVSNEVKTQMGNIIVGVKMAAGVSWNGFFSQLNTQVQNALTTMYGLR